MENVVDLLTHRKIKSLNKNIKELTEISGILKKTIQELTKFEQYSSIRRSVGDLFTLYQDIKVHKNKKIEILERLKNEQN
jgi:hypothetical protein